MKRRNSDSDHGVRSPKRAKTANATSTKISTNASVDGADNTTAQHSRSTHCCCSRQLMMSSALSAVRSEFESLCAAEFGWAQSPKESFNSFVLVSLITPETTNIPTCNGAVENSLEIKALRRELRAALP